MMSGCGNSRTCSRAVTDCGLPYVVVFLVEFTSRDVAGLQAVTRLDVGVASTHMHTYLQT
jgi:hypothetical protein